LRATLYYMQSGSWYQLIFMLLSDMLPAHMLPAHMLSAHMLQPK